MSNHLMEDDENDLFHALDSEVHEISSDSEASLKGVLSDCDEKPIISDGNTSSFDLTLSKLCEEPSTSKWSQKHEVRSLNSNEVERCPEFTNSAGGETNVHVISSDSESNFAGSLSDCDVKYFGGKTELNTGNQDSILSVFDEETRSPATLPPDRESISSSSTIPPLGNSLSSDTLPPCEPTLKFQKIPSFHDLSDSDEGSNCDSSPAKSRFPSPSPSEPPELLTMQSEPILSNSYTISEFISQLNTNSQPLATSSQPSTSQKRPNVTDILEKKRLKELKMKEKSERAAIMEKVRRMRPGECMKYITLILDQNIVSEYLWAQDMIQILTSAGINHVVEPASDPCSVKWTREQAEKIEPQQENHVLFIWSTDRLLTSVQYGTLCDTFADLKKKYERFKMYLCVYGLQNYIKKYNNAKKRENSRANPPQRKRKSNYSVNLDQIELELIALQIRFGMSHKILNTPQEAASFLQSITKSIAEMPFKLEKEKMEKERNWYAKGDSKKCVRIDKDFNGLKQLWLQQLSQFNLSSLDIAKCIVQVYPTPLSLFEAYNKCSTLKERENMLQDILVKRGPGGGGRRLGPELSRKISLMFCQTEDIPLG